MVESLFRDRTVSWVWIVNGIDKYVTETSETISLENVEHRVTGTPFAKAKPRPKPTMTLSPISIPVHERNWIDINPVRFRQDCFLQCQKPWSDCCDMIHQFLERMMEQYDLTIIWKHQGKVRWYFAMANYRLDNVFWQREEDQRRCFNIAWTSNSSKHFLCFRAIQGHSGGNLVDPALQDNVLIPKDLLSTSVTSEM